ncbi:MAG TPA: hypothetical protein VHZ53_20815 [Steroidobacteraceae bacterium]|jgi:hypothetical protein|nr:hypothetical protein [Steroidobacteraceae bacterium]
MRTSPSSDANVRSSAYCVAHTLIECWHCGRITPVVALAVPSGHETRGESDEGEMPAAAGSPAAAGPQVAAGPPVGAGSGTETWDRIDACALLFMVREISDRVGAELQRLAPAFRRSDGPSSFESRWANHCDRCGRALEDQVLHGEPDVAFVPTSAGRARSIVIETVREPFEAGIDGYSLDPLFLDVP